MVIVKKGLETINIFPLEMTVLWSIVFGLSMHDWVIGICMGVCFGIAFGLFGSDKDEDENDKEERS